MKAFLKNYRQSPRKVRLVATLIKGKKVATALLELDFLAKKAAGPIKKLINSAVANASANFNIPPEDLYIKSITVNQGTVMKRHIPGAHGRAFPIQKKSSYVLVILDTKPVDKHTNKRMMPMKRMATNKNKSRNSHNS
ncbi:MAG: 50S ribosomal protein L22 [Patescibacteria group bacterium]